MRRVSTFSRKKRSRRKVPSCTARSRSRLVAARIRTLIGTRFTLKRGQTHLILEKIACGRALWLYAPSPARSDARRSPPRHTKGKRSPARILFDCKPKFLSESSGPARRPLRHQDSGLLPDEQSRSYHRRASV